ncbi:hypothetical protein CC1G_03902 [Coprinopsis cinerea okayama7|uniref:Uncharacterized protein n=1 Tax=Coprinopsis cinerea (strain Okayama-7 / 130 / ATCC MYA-4618 / FGSC 9003) TaxID=240176 RepID=A8NH55_COPC7|nr:hypothetical protein CC1G_03902 [Coprinopsis cinerea okayama7\|eukprot:XP_001833685.2 hypothetical protein CC1G_03902 [Coprinopsis cinerea okayama7\
MSSAASSSGSVNGRAPHTNGTAPHPEVGTSTTPFYEQNTASPASTSYPVNGFSHTYTKMSTASTPSSCRGLPISPIPCQLLHRQPARGSYTSISIMNPRSLKRPENARAVLAAGCLLGGMDDLCQYAYEVCRRSLSVETVGAWLQFLDTSPPSTDGTMTPVTPEAPAPPTTVFGHYAQRLRDDVFHFLVVTLPEVLEVRQPQPDASGRTGRDVLLQVYAQVPFEMFKSAVESPTFNIGPDQDRFAFAKAAIELRKRGIARGTEEAVVLAFGANSSTGGSAVHITRKTRRRQLWKVNS